MKYIKEFEKIDNSMSKFKVGDCVISTGGRRGVVSEAEYSKYRKEFLYSLEEYPTLYFEEKVLYLMTPDQIESYDISKITNKFNI
jgi:hypothetical protein